MLKIVLLLIKRSLCIISLLLLLSCGSQNKPAEIKLQGKTMGTQYHISIPLNTSNKAHNLNTKRLQVEIEKKLQTINQEMSTYIPSSVISQFNNSQSQDWFPVSIALLKLINTAQTISQNSQGAFDISVMPLVNLWGFGTTSKKDTFPQQSEIDVLKKHVGYQLLQTQQQPPAIRKQHPQLMIDLSAIAKGYAVDALAMLLVEKGLEHFLVEIGGEIRVRGKNKQSKLWRIAIEKPTSLDRSVQQGLKLDNIAIATSGDYRNYYEKDGKRYSHMINPKTGKPIKHKLASVTVLNKSSMIADAQATALMVLGENKGKAYAQQHELEVYMIFRKNNAFSVWHNLKTTRIIK
ncbi:MAG TPA: FAD:protein FMN transferase [Leucothrix mucor]|nr:FAD:protein FMN transferase [Leucothrix mucor]